MSEKPSSRRPGRGAFVGREHELGELEAGLDDARSGRGRFFLVTGEPGIGKSRLADELAAHAASTGMLVLRAACGEGGGAPAYWSFVQLIRAALGGADRDIAGSRVGREHAPHVMQDVAQLLPELRQLVAAPACRPRHRRPEHEQARFRLSESIAMVLRALAAITPLMLVVEDLHDADQPSLLMLRFVVRQLKDAPVLILGTYRDVEVQRSPALSRLIGDLTREGTQIPLFALSRADAARMIEERAGGGWAPISIGYSSRNRRQSTFYRWPGQGAGGRGRTAQRQPPGPRGLQGSRRGAGSDPPLAGPALGPVDADHRSYHRAGVRTAMLAARERRAEPPTPRCVA